MLDTREYIIFVLGYDELIRSKFKEHNQQECDLAYNICEKIADDFIGSIYNLSDYRGNASMYDQLCKFLEDVKIDRYFPKKETAVKLHIYFKGEVGFDEAYNRIHSMLDEDTDFQMYEAEVREV